MNPRVIFACLALTLLGTAGLVAVGCESSQAQLSTATLAAAADLQASADKLPDGKEKTKILAAKEDLVKAEATGFDPVGLVLTFAQGHPGLTYAAAGLAALWAALKAVGFAKNFTLSPKKPV